MNNEKSHDDTKKEIAKKICSMCGKDSKGDCRCPAGIFNMMLGSIGNYSIALSIVFSGLFIGVALIIALPSSSDNYENSGDIANLDYEIVDLNDGDYEENNLPAQEAEIQLPPVTVEDHIRGSINAPIKIVEYSDIECPYCQSVHPTLQNIVNQYNGDVAWVYRHFPLGFHNNAKPAAIASECVAELGDNDGFWQFVDYLFENQSTALNTEGYEQQAQLQGIDINEFRSCANSGRYDQKIDDHMAGGSLAGVTGTPGNIIVTQDGKTYSIVGAQPIGAFTSIIDQHI
jgi:protein-disulfide isomerase